MERGAGSTRGGQGSRAVKALGTVGCGVNLEPQAGLTDGVSKLMTEHVAALLRESAAFGRVVASADLMALVDLERQKQMANCANDSCMAELAGALGVEFLVTGNLGKLGESYLLNIKMLDVKRAVTLASVSERFMGKSEEALLDGVQPAVFKLLNLSGLKHTLAQQGKIAAAPAPLMTETPAVQSSPAPAPQPAANPAAPPAASPVAPATRPGWVVPALGAGSFALFAGALVLATALVVGAVTGVWLRLAGGNPDFLREELPKGDARTSTVILSTVAGAVAAGVLVLVGLLIVAAGGTTLVVAATQF